MSATNAFETACLNLYFTNTDHANIGDAGGLQNSVADGSFYISLHTASPTETGNQTSSEAAYGAYARQAVGRTAGWTVSGNTADNAAAITFPEATSGSETETYFGIGSDSTGTGNLFWYGAITDPAVGLAVATGVQPEFAIGALDVTLD